MAKRRKSYLDPSVRDGLITGGVIIAGWTAFYFVARLALRGQKGDEDELATPEEIRDMLIGPTSGIFAETEAGF